MFNLTKKVLIVLLVGTLISNIALGLGVVAAYHEGYTEGVSEGVVIGTDLSENVRNDDNNAGKSPLISGSSQKDDPPNETGRQDTQPTASVTFNQINDTAVEVKVISLEHADNITINSESDQCNPCTANSVGESTLITGLEPEHNVRIVASYNGHTAITQIFRMDND